MRFVSESSLLVLVSSYRKLKFFVSNTHGCCLLVFMIEQRGSTACCIVGPVERAGGKGDSGEGRQGRTGSFLRSS